MREKPIDKWKALVPIVCFFIVEIIIIEIIAFEFWSTLYPSAGNVPEVLVAPVFTNRFISVPAVIAMIVVLVLRVKNMIRFTSVAIFTVSILVVVLALSIIIKGMVNTNRISENDLIRVITWPNNFCKE
jgi:hypothetical protein